MMRRRLTAILAADVVGYSRLMGADEAGTLAALEELRTNVIEPKINQLEGHTVKLTGGGMLVEFPSVVNAVACAVAIQSEIRERNANETPNCRLELRVGVNLGDVISEAREREKFLSDHADRNPRPLRLLSCRAKSRHLLLLSR
jgi:adenylate cyclase